MALLGPYETEALALVACGEAPAMSLQAAEMPCKNCNKAKMTKKNAQLPAKPCNCASKALTPPKIDRKSIMM